MQRRKLAQYLYSVGDYVKIKVRDKEVFGRIAGLFDDEVVIEFFTGSKTFRRFQEIQPVKKKELKQIINDDIEENPYDGF